MTVVEEFVEWAWGLRGDRIPEATTAAACRHLLDGIGTAIAARRLGAAEPAVRVAQALDGTGPARVLGDVEGRPAPFAALANGVLVHALDFDDTHADALVHPTAVVLPAALAVAEETGADGATLLGAAVAGYELVLRLGAAVPHGFHARGFHATSVCGTLSSALVAARLSGLTRAQAVDALGIAGSQASGSLEFLATGASTKQLHPGWASHAGILAARLARAGASGPGSVVEGGAGLLALYTDGEADPASVTAGLGSRWETTRITVKPSPVCQLSHASLDALAQVLPVDPAAVRRVVVDLPRAAASVVAEPRADKLAPRTPYDAKFSLPWCAAVLLLDGRIDVDSFTAARMHRPDVAELATRVEVRVTDPDVAPAAAPGRVEVHLADDTVATGTVARSRGGPGNPMPDAEVAAKFHRNCGGRTAASEELAAAVLQLPELDEIHRLTDLAHEVVTKAAT